MNTDTPHTALEPAIEAHEPTIEAHEPAPYRVTIKNWPEGERPREKLTKHGPEALSEAELLAILINSGTGKKSAVDVARDLLTRYKDIRTLSQRSVGELVRMEGIGPARAVNILAAFELGRRSAAVEDYTEGINGPESVAQIYIPKMRDLPFERFMVLMLNNAGKILREEIISEGTATATVIHPREVFRSAVIEMATSVILVHNHPSGVRSPSRADHDITRQMVEAGKLMDIPVQDHVIICGNSYVSFKDNGWL